MPNAQFQNSDSAITDNTEHTDNTDNTDNPEHTAHTVNPLSIAHHGIVPPLWQKV